MLILNYSDSDIKFMIKMFVSTFRDFYLIGQQLFLLPNGKKKNSFKGEITFFITPG